MALGLQRNVNMFIIFQRASSKKRNIDHIITSKDAV